MNLSDDASDALIVHSVVDLGHNLGLTIVAEGVETAAALTSLAGYGCDIAEGYYLSRPAAIDALDAWRHDQATCLQAAPAAHGTSIAPTEFTK